MNTQKITLNKTVHEIKELRSRANREWRKKLEQPFQELAGLLANAPNIELNATALPELSDLLKILVGRVAGSIDIMVDLLMEYSPELKAIEETLLEECYDSELIEAFASVLKLAYPFGQLRRILNIQDGSTNNQTSQN